MKTAIYIEDGVAQIVLTPESEWEKRVVEGIKTGDTFQVMRGRFYECVGGWNRTDRSGDSSLILRTTNGKEVDA